MLSLRNGVALPAIGLGTYKAKGESLVKAIQWAVDCGIGHLETAMTYRNDKEIHEGLREAGKKLDDVFITSKLGPRFHGEDAAYDGCERAFKALETDKIDLMLIHWPGTFGTTKTEFDLPQLRLQTWKVLEDFYKQGRFRAIGVSNYEVIHLKELMSSASVPPMVNQIEVHPRFPNRAVRDYCKAEGIQVMAYSPLGTGDLVKNATILELAERLNKSPAQVSIVFASGMSVGDQVLLKWGLQQGLAVIPKSVHKEYIEEWQPSAMDGWSLSAEDVKTLDAMDDGFKYCWNPTKVP